MKIKIDKDGRLEIERAGRWMKQLCPWVNVVVACGDWCPHFGEPREDAPQGMSLWICHDTCLQGDLTDERGQP